MWRSSAHYEDLRQARVLVQVLGKLMAFPRMPSYCAFQAWEPEALVPDKPEPGQ